MVREFLERIDLKRKQSWVEHYFIYILIGAAITFMIICLSIGLQQSVWFDEAYSIWLAKQPVDQLFYLTSIDTHPPLYYLLLKAWGLLFGWGELALRSLSIVAAGGAVVVAGLLTRRMFGAKVGFLALPFIVFAPFLLRYGFEIRMYALASLIGIAATYILVRALETKDARRQWQLYIIYGILVALGVYTLYYTVVLWAAHVVWLVWLARSQKQPILKQPWVAAFSGSVLLFLPWLPTFVAQIGNGALAPVSQALTMDNLVGIVSFMFLYQPTWQLGAVASLGILFVIIGAAYFAIKASRQVSAKRRSYLMLIGLYIAVPIAIIALISLIRPMYVERYLAHVLIGASLFIGVSIAIVLEKARKKIWIIAGAMLAIMIIGTIHLGQVGNYNFQRQHSSTMKQAAGYIGECEPGRTILAGDPYAAIELAYYLPSCAIYFYSPWPTLIGGYAPLSGSPLQVKEPAKELRSSKELVHIYYGRRELKMPPHLRQSSDKDFDQLHVTTFSAE